MISYRGRRGQIALFHSWVVFSLHTALLNLQTFVHFFTYIEVFQLMDLLTEFFLISNSLVINTRAHTCTRFSCDELCPRHMSCHCGTDAAAKHCDGEFVALFQSSWNILTCTICSCNCPLVQTVPVPQCCHSRRAEKTHCVLTGWAESQLNQISQRLCLIMLETCWL